MARPILSDPSLTPTHLPIGLSPRQYAELALLAADQAGLSLREQERLAEALEQALASTWGSL